jgi:hypothetical protein
MDSEKPVPNVGTSNAQDTTTNPPAGGGEFRVQRGGMPPPPFFQGFHGGHMPFLFPPSFMQPVQGVGFPIPLQSAPPPTIDLTAGSEKRGSQECATEPSKTIKKQRLTRKKPEIVELDDAKAEVDAVKCQSGGHWKDHWVIQLITIRGEMHSTFSAPPKQGTPPNSFFLVVCFDFDFVFFVFFFNCFRGHTPGLHPDRQRTGSRHCWNFITVPAVRQTAASLHPSSVCSGNFLPELCWPHWTPVSPLSACWLAGCRPGASSQPAARRYCCFRCNRFRSIGTPSAVLGLIPACMYVCAALIVIFRLLLS